MLKVLSNDAYQSELHSGLLFDYVEDLKESEENLIICFYKCNNDDNSLEDLIFFLTDQFDVKSIRLKNQKDFKELLHNLFFALLNKETKKHITTFENKPPAHSNLAIKHGLLDKKELNLVTQLVCIPGVSELKAVAVVKQYRSVRELYDFLMSKAEEDVLWDLSEIVLENKNKGTRKKLGEKIAKLIYDVFVSLDGDYVIN